MRSIQFKKGNLVFFIVLTAMLFLNVTVLSIPLNSNINAQVSPGNQTYYGVDMRGVHTAVSQVKNSTLESLPPNYYEDSFRILHDAGMNHVRYTFYWEAYVVDPVSFMNELQMVANAADKYGIKVIYDNHQFHTSSYLNPQRGNGFPASLFEGDPKFTYGAGGSPKYEAAKLWWTDWWDRKIRDVNGTDGWTLLFNFLHRIVTTLDSHPSTIGIRNT